MSTTDDHAARFQAFAHTMLNRPTNTTSTFKATTTAEEVVTHFKDLVKGKTVVITGPTKGGLGWESARVLVKQGARVVLVGRSVAKLNEAKESILQETKDASIELVEMDLGSIKSIEKAVQQFSYPIDVLINNAGIMAAPYSTTTDGFESQFGCNGLGHWLFTKLLIPRLLESTHKPARVINVSSFGHHMGMVDLKDPNFTNGATYDKWAAYGASKTANILLSVALNERYPKEELISFALHPGGINTNLGRHMSSEEGAAMMKPFLNDDGTPKGSAVLWKTLEQGASTQLVAAFSNLPELLAPQGKKPGNIYLDDCSISDDVEDYAIDPANAAKLWSLYEELVASRA